ncbi:hypothetical protein Ciccas_011709 [Cichlidogyrus casuarinus]|uniref:FMP27 C-terminal domain-containing protein n=1 Tax=Cichlidogyrus casuarinus TaxID=1844966 RepID=A0ABD2PS64_9PLAT
MCDVVRVSEKEEFPSRNSDVLPDSPKADGPSSVKSTDQEQQKVKMRQPDVLRRSEICFEHAQWKLANPDGLEGIADVEIRGFLYTRTHRDDDSGSHGMQLGWIRVSSLMKDFFYREVLEPDITGGQHTGSAVLKIGCVQKPPVLGISVIEAMEISIAPLRLQISKNFYTAMMPYFFPDKYQDDIQISSSDGAESRDQDSQSLSTVPDSAENRSHRRFGQLKPSAKTAKKLLHMAHLRRNQNKSRNDMTRLQAAEDSTDDGAHELDQRKISLLALDCEAILWRRFHLLHGDSVVVEFDKSQRKSLSSLDFGYDWDAECRPFMVEEGLAYNTDGWKDADIDQDDSGSMGSNELNQISSLEQQKIVDLMRERARRNIVFLYIKIPGFPIRLSYKGVKQKNVTDVTDFPLNISTLEYRSCTWTWLDFALEIKSRIRRQLIKELLKKPFKFSRVFQRLSNRQSKRLSEASLDHLRNNALDLSVSMMDQDLSEDEFDLSVGDISSMSQIPEISVESTRRSSDLERRYQNTMKMILGPLVEEVSKSPKKKKGKKDKQ